MTTTIMDTFIPTIPEANPEGIERRFKYDSLTKIEGEPTYEQMYIVREELCRNAIAIKSSFGGGKHGHLGAVTKPSVYLTETGETWSIPATSGVYPTFHTGATDDEKKKEIAEFIERETNIKVAEMVEELLKNQFLEAVDEEYIMVLKQGVLRYDGTSLNDLVQHIFDNYAKIDDLLVIKNKKEFEEPPDLTRPIDVYYKKQEDCQKLAADSEVAISEPEMVLQMQTHLGSTGMINSKYLKWKRMTKTERNWKDGKKYFREALGDVEDLNKLTTGEAGLTANNASIQPIDQQVRNEYADKLGESFDNLVQAATSKADTLDAMATSIGQLTTSIAELTATNKKLTSQLESALAKLKGGSNSTTKEKSEWPHNPDGYCWTCGYKVSKKHNSGTCFKGKDCPNHKKEATRNNTMGGSTEGAGYGNAPNGK